VSAPIHVPEVPANSRSGPITAVRVLSAVAVLLVLFMILAPQDRTEASAMYSSYAAGAGGTRALYEVLGRLHLAVTRNDRPLTSPPDTSSTYILLKPAQPLTSVEEARLLRAVRHGATVVFTLENDAFADSLGFELDSPRGGFATLRLATVAGGNPPARDTPEASSLLQTAFPINVVVRSKSASGNQAFLWLDPPAGNIMPLDSAQRPALILGHRVGRGYAIAVAPAPIVMNQVVRDPRIAIAMVRAIQFAITTRAPSQRSSNVIFDEYHHGYGTHADMVAAVRYALAATPVGRMTIELIAAALVLLLAFGVRPLAPVSVPPVSRRSPLEHVGALAHAYSQVDARALGANRLVRGIRRRHPLGLPRSLPDASYLSALRARIPAASADVDRISAALAPDSSSSSAHFADVGAAVANIERAFPE
jgi:uncharacterized protein DUF4350